MGIKKGEEREDGMMGVGVSPNTPQVKNPI